MPLLVDDLASTFAWSRHSTARPESCASFEDDAVKTNCVQCVEGDGDQIRFVDPVLGAVTYADLPSKQVKVRVRNRGVIVTADAERRAVRPEGMQAAIDAAVAACGEGSAARAFARPSGTEDVVRVYAEARTRELADALARSVARVVYAQAGGVGDEP